MQQIYYNRNIFLIILNDGGTKNMELADLVSGEDLLLDSQMAAFVCLYSHGRNSGESSQGSFIKV